MPKKNGSYAGSFMEQHIEPTGRGGRGAATKSGGGGHYCGVGDATLNPDGSSSRKGTKKGKKGY